MQQSLGSELEEIVRLFRAIEKEIRKQFISKIKKDGFTASEIMIMSILCHHPEITLKELSEHAGLAKAQFAEL